MFEGIILNILKGSEGMSYTDIAAGIKEEMDMNSIEFTGSVEWYTVCVKQHLESTGFIESLMQNGRKIHRLR
ncbi:MAG: hypothetical protein H6551_01550 [Chitinophagales bacterium]|nr:hypothetical protein [Chitinophagaceae bacterium]MCB9063809.1 hypothetical protein [Chitinophagales bacterium]